jgi:uncharacterized protein DUF2510
VFTPGARVEWLTWELSERKHVAARPSRLSYGAVAAGIGGLLLILSLFLDWVDTGFGSGNAFRLFSIVDLFLLVVGIAAVGFAAIEAFALNVQLPVDRVRTLTVLGIISTSIVWAFLFEADEQAIGFYLAAIASLAILAGGILAQRNPSLGVANPAAAGGPLAGVGQGTGGGTPPPAGPAQPAAAPPAAAKPAAAAPGAQPAAGANADWYPDPRGEKRLRYWDGSQWTDHTAD